MDGKHREPGAGPEDHYDAEGYDDTQRAEILEAESVGPTDGIIEIDISPDLGGGDADDDEIEDDADHLQAIEDSDDLDPADEDRVGYQGNEDDTNRQDTQNVT